MAGMRAHGFETAVVLSFNSTRIRWLESIERLRLSEEVDNVAGAVSDRALYHAQLHKQALPCLTKPGDDLLSAIATQGHCKCLGKQPHCHSSSAQARANCQQRADDHGNAK
mmetsp:Transcript_9490/g.33615  ORF Transcript_9490/g.33615 Transcript_9490/m.33615 type:complete len:111 (-) Transcript_9490:1096-1428(-)